VTGVAAPFRFASPASQGLAADPPGNDPAYTSALPGGASRPTEFLPPWAEARRPRRGQGAIVTRVVAPKPERASALSV
jgi:hypothetical protein